MNKVKDLHKESLAAVIVPPAHTEHEAIPFEYYSHLQAGSLLLAQIYFKN